VLDPLGGWRSFALDPAAPEVRPWPTARRHYTIRDNGLIKPWRGRVWLNPPYSLLGRFLARMAEHGIGVALLFARTDIDPFFRHVWDAASAVLFVRGRLTFCTPDGSLARREAGAPSVLAAYGAADAEVLAFCGIGGRFVPLRLPRFVAVDLVEALTGTWRDVIAAFVAERGEVAVDDLYRLVAAHPKAGGNRHVRAKLRQIINGGEFAKTDGKVRML
jgi:hypothetical protein